MYTFFSTPLSFSEFPSHIFPDGSYIVWHSPQEIEVCGVNISEHYTMRIQANDVTKMDVVYLGISPVVHA